MSARAFWSMCNSIPVRTSFRKPASSASTRYLPIGSNSALNDPVSSVINDRLKFVPSLTMVTLTPGITAPDGSFTVPRIVPRETCDQALVVRIKVKRRAFNNCLRIISLQKGTQRTKRDLWMLKAGGSLAVFLYGGCNRHKSFHRTRHDSTLSIEFVNKV